MSIGEIFWVIMLLLLIFGFGYRAAPDRFGNWGWAGGGLIIFILFFLLGWKNFGFIIHQ
jgi:hypothetical protein